MQSILALSRPESAFCIGFRPLHVAKELLGRGQEFVVSYLGLGALGASLARLYTVTGFGFGAVLTVLAPLLFARQMFLRSQALEEAHKELKDREQVSAHPLERDG